MKGKQNYFFPVLFLCTVVQWCGEKRQSHLFWYDLSVPGRAVGKGLYFWNRGQKNFIGMHLFLGRHSHFRPETWRYGVHSYRDQHWGRAELWVSACQPLSWAGAATAKGAPAIPGVCVSTAMGLCGARGPLQKLSNWQVVFLFSRVQKTLSFYLDETKAFRKYLGLYFFFSKICRKSRKLHSFIMHASELISLWICYKLAGKLMASRVAAYPTWV